MTGADAASSGSSRESTWLSLFDCATRLIDAAQPVLVLGRLTRVTGMVLEATAIQLPVGSVCQVQRASDGGQIQAEVVGFAQNRLLLMPVTDIHGLTPGDRVTALEMPSPAPRLGFSPPARRRKQDKSRQLPVGAGLLGRVVNATGAPMDGRGPLNMVQPLPIRSRPVSAMARAPVKHRLATGVAAIDTLLTVGRGQRLGLFAQAGVGKSVLLGMMAANTSADVIVVALVGERGREVREFIERTLTATTRQRTTIVAAPSDEPPLMKIQAATYAARIAEFYREQGLHVLLIMDSLTRYAMATRDVALSIGESPATRGYPPSVFARLPEFLERAGNGPDGSGSITSFYTVLTDADDSHDPVGEAARSYLDGHVVLSRELAQEGLYPAIDLSQSVSRVMPAVAEQSHQQAAAIVRQAWARYRENAELISIGAYVPGSDPFLDRAMNLWPDIQALLYQSMDAVAHPSQWHDDLIRLAMALTAAPPPEDSAEEVRTTADG